MPAIPMNTPPASSWTRRALAVGIVGLALATVAAPALAHGARPRVAAIARSATAVDGGGAGVHVAPASCGSGPKSSWATWIAATPSSRA